MTHASEPIELRSLRPSDQAIAPPSPLSLPGLAASIVLIPLGALAMASLCATIILFGLYAQFGLEWLTMRYQELRFDPAAKTEIGAVVVGIFYASIAGATYGSARWRAGRSWRVPIAWLPVAGPRATILAIAVATVAYAGVTTYFLSRSHHPLQDGPTNYLLLGTFTANLVVMAPCAEELFFRGWLFTGLRQRLAFWPSLLITATVFAAIHWDLHRPRVLLVLPLAIATGVVRELTGSVKPAIALHVAYNLVIVAVRLWET